MFLYSCAQLLVSEWIWGMTWDVYHIPFNIIIMLFLLKFFLKIDMVRAICMSIFSQFFAFFLFSMCAVGVMYFIGRGGGPESYTMVPRPLYATLLLGAIYALLQIMFFIFTSARYKMPLSVLIALAVISNNLTVLVTLLLFSIA